MAAPEKSGAAFSFRVRPNAPELLSEVENHEPELPILEQESAVLGQDLRKDVQFLPKNRQLLFNNQRVWHCR
jgi:hypothetical protein